MRIKLIVYEPYTRDVGKDIVRVSPAICPRPVRASPAIGPNTENSNQNLFSITIYCGVSHIHTHAGFLYPSEQDKLIIRMNSQIRNQVHKKIGEMVEVELT